jgi:hypothetical protein
MTLREWAMRTTRHKNLKLDITVNQMLEILGMACETLYDEHGEDEFKLTAHVKQMVTLARKRKVATSIYP